MGEVVAEPALMILFAEHFIPDHVKKILLKNGITQVADIHRISFQELKALRK